jgi:hypothetical protein
MTFSWFSPFLGGGSVGNPTPALLPLHLRAGWGWGCGWLGLPLFSVFANARTGAGGKGQPLHMTIYLSYTLCSMFPGIFLPNFSLTHTYSPIVGPFWREGPHLLPHSSFLSLSTAH